MKKEFKKNIRNLSKDYIDPKEFVRFSNELNELLQRYRYRYGQQGFMTLVGLINKYDYRTIEEEQKKYRKEYLKD